MKRMRSLLLISAALLAACGRDREKVADDALKNDLVLASQAQPFGAQQYTNPAELGYVFNPNTGRYEPVPTATPAAAAPSLRSAPTVRRASTASRASSSSSGGSRIIYREPPEPRRNTKRDAAIGAAAGAVIGATTSRDKLKGGIIGAAAGAVLGGIIGHTVDVQRP